MDERLMCQNLQEMEIICFKDLFCAAGWWLVQYTAPILGVFIKL